MTTSSGNLERYEAAAMRLRSYAEIEEKLVANYRKKQRRFHALPKIGSALVFTVATFFVSMMDNFRDHPLYEVLTEREYIEYVRSYDLTESVTNLMEYEGHLIQSQELTPKSRLLKILRAYVMKDQVSMIYLDGPLNEDGLLKPVSFYFSRKHVQEAISELETKATEVAEMAEVDNRTEELLLPFLLQHEGLSEEVFSQLKEGDYGKGPEVLWNLLSELDRLWPESYDPPLGMMRPLDEQGQLLAYRGTLEELSGELKLIHDEANAFADVWLINKILVPLYASLAWFVLIWLRERSDDSWIEFLLTDEGTETLLARLCQRGGADSDVTFTPAELRKAARSKKTPKYLKPFLGWRVNPALLREVVEVLISRLLAEGVIVRSSQSGVQQHYSVRPPVARALRRGGQNKGMRKSNRSRSA